MSIAPDEVALGHRRETPAPVLPVALKLAGRSVLVVGGGRVAERKVRDVLAARATVTLVTPSLTASLRDLVATTPSITWRPREVREQDLDGVHLVITATGVESVDQMLFDAAHERGLWFNSADDPDRCSFYLCALVRRDPVVVAVTTSGTSPALASYLRRRIDALLEDELGAVALLVSEARDDLHRAGRSTESLSWDRVIDDDVIATVGAGRLDEARTRIRQSLGLA